MCVCLLPGSVEVFPACRVLPIVQLEACASTSLRRTNSEHVFDATPLAD